MIKNYQGIKDVKVYGEAHSIYGEIVNATIVTKNEKKLDEKQLLTYCKQFLADYKLPNVIYYTDKLNFTASGKLQR